MIILIRYLRSAKDIESYKLAEAEYNLTDSYQRGREIQAAFTKESGFWDVQGSTSKLPVFIIGFFRSGSTLLETMLDAHPSIWGMGEESVFPQAVLSLNREIIALMEQATLATKRVNAAGNTDPTAMTDRLKMIVDAHAAAIITAMHKRRYACTFSYKDLVILLTLTLSLTLILSLLSLLCINEGTRVYLIEGDLVILLTLTLNLNPNLNPYPNLIITAIHNCRRLFEMHFNDSFSPIDNDLHPQSTDTYPTHKINNHFNFGNDDDEEEEEEEKKGDENLTKSGASSPNRTPVRRITHPIPIPP